MKKSLLIMAFFGLALVGYSQTKGDLKGPAAKNFKPWNSTMSIAMLTSVEDKEVLQGPARKNQKPQALNNQLTRVVAVGSKRNGLKGPARKNYKPWKD